MKVIAISGYKKSGKDTAANYLISNHNFTRAAFADALKDLVAQQYDIPRESLDNQDLKEKPLEQYPVTPKDDFSLNVCKFMYKEFRTLNGKIPLDYFIDPSGAFMGIMDYRNSTEQLYQTPRSLAIIEGSIKRTVDSSYWVQKTIAGIFNNVEDPGWNPVTDKWNNQSLFVISDLRYRSEIVQLRQAFGKDLVTVRVNRFATTESQDPSERDLDKAKFDIEIANTGTLEEFLQNVERLLV